MQEQHMQDKFVYGFRLYTYGVLCYKSVVDQMHESLGFEAGNLLARGVTQDDAENIYNSVLNQADEAHFYFKQSIDFLNASAQAGHGFEEYDDEYESEEDYGEEPRPRINSDGNEQVETISEQEEDSFSE